MEEIMIIGLAKEIKTEEYRVGLTPSGAQEYVHHGHTVLVEKSAGVGSGFSDEDYSRAGCEITKRKSVFDRAEMIVKVKEPLEQEYELFHEGQILYTYLHLAAAKELTEALLKTKIIGVAYETVMESDGSLPLLKPMSEIAGRLSIQEGAKYLEKPFGGRGILLGGVPGIRRGKVVIIGGGIVGINACKIAVGIGSEVTVLDISADRLAYLDDIFGSSITTLYSNEANISQSLQEADLVVGAVLIPGGAAPKLVRREHLKIMRQGAVIVDVAVDQGGCCETTKPTYHSDPIFIIDGVVHYCVANMPGVVALSSTYALTSVTNRYGLLLADNGIEQAIAMSEPLKHGVNIYKGELKNKPVADALGLKYSPWK
jgi:alanine dehydrogenase